MANNYHGKTAFITGGAEGIGLSIAQALATKGMNIVLADIDEQNAKAAAQALSEFGTKAISVSLDVASLDQWPLAFSEAIDALGPIHMLVNNAGVGGIAGPIDTQTEKSWRWAIDVNLMGVVFGAKTAITHMKQHGQQAWLVNVASMAGMGGVPFSSAYTATKNAVVALSEAWAGELKKENISVSVLCPAFVNTSIHKSIRNRQASYQEAIELDAFSARLAEGAKQLVENGIDVKLVGERLIEGLDDKEMYIFTHPNYRPVTQRRCQAIDQAFARAAQSNVVGHLVDREIDLL